jgi:lysophospholipase L1-like esterase
MLKPFLDYIGLYRPYRFERTIPALTALFLMMVVVAVAGWLAATDRLIAGGPRAHYFLYLLSLLVLAIALVRWPWVAAVPLVLALVDLSWGVGVRALQGAGYSAVSLLPPVSADPDRFQWHALLQAVPIPSLKFTSTTGLVINHTSEGTRGQDPAPRSLEGRTVVATFGGSTTYDIGASDGDTWSDRLADALGRDSTYVVNHGVPGYSTVEHLIQTAFYQTKFGKPPRCAIYYVGWNDIRNAHIPNLDPGYADFHLPSQVDSQKVRRIGGSHVTISPALTMLARFVSANIDTVRYSADPYGRAPVSGSDPALEALYERNIRSISAINRARGIVAIWVGQLLNREQLQSDGRYGWLPLVRDRDVWPLQQRFNAILERTAQSLGDVYVAIPPDSFTGADFVDNGHFSARGARRFAEDLAPTVRGACR